MSEPPYRACNHLGIFSLLMAVGAWSSFSVTSGDSCASFSGLPSPKVSTLLLICERWAD